MKNPRPLIMDFSQQEIISTYFDGISKPNASLRKRKRSRFASPDWSILQSYLFSWIYLNQSTPNGNTFREHIKHIAFHIWVYLTMQDRVIIKLEGTEQENDNVWLRDLRGWWLKTEGKFPRDYEAWLKTYEWSLPGACTLFIC